MRDRTDPFVQLERSHRRLEERLDDLVRTSGDPDVLRDVAAFFSRAVRRHEADEERSLFPRLRARASEEITELLARLEREHREHEALHARLDAIIQMLDGGTAPPAHDVETLADALVRTYRSHIEEEERVVFPAARQVLDAAELEAMMREMEERRGR